MWIYIQELWVLGNCCVFSQSWLCLAVGNKSATLFLLHRDSGNVFQQSLNIKCCHQISNWCVIEPLIYSSCFVFFMAEVVKIIQFKRICGCFAPTSWQNFLTASHFIIQDERSGLLYSITVSVKWLLSQPVSSYCSAKMEMRWKSGGDFNLGQLESEEKVGERVIDVCFDAFNGIESLR